MINPTSNNGFLQDAKTAYREFWDRCWHGHENKQECRFDGSVEDIHMLAYCEYELGHPSEGYQLASYLWGNVIQKHTSLKWGTNHAGTIYLFSNDHTYPFNIDVSLYVSEFIEAGISQDDSFEFLTEKLALELIGNEFPPESYSRLAEIVRQLTADNGTSYANYICYSIQELYGLGSNQCKEIVEMMSGN